MVHSDFGIIPSSAYYSLDWIYVLVWKHFLYGPLGSNLLFHQFCFNSILTYSWVRILATSIHAWLIKNTLSLLNLPLDHFLLLLSWPLPFLGLPTVPGLGRNPPGPWLECACPLILCPWAEGAPGLVWFPSRHPCPPPGGGSEGSDRVCPWAEPMEPCSPQSGWWPTSSVVPELVFMAMNILRVGWYVKSSLNNCTVYKIVPLPTYV